MNIKELFDSVVSQQLVWSVSALYTVYTGIHMRKKEL